MHLKTFYTFNLNFDLAEKFVNSDSKKKKIKLQKLVSDLNFNAKFYINSILKKNNFWYFADILLIFFFESKFKSASSFCNQPSRFLNPNIYKKIGKLNLLINISSSFIISENLIEVELILGE